MKTPFFNFKGARRLKIGILSAAFLLIAGTAFSGLLTLTNTLVTMLMEVEFIELQLSWNANTTPLDFSPPDPVAYQQQYDSWAQAYQEFQEAMAAGAEWKLALIDPRTRQVFCQTNGWVSSNTSGTLSCGLVPFEYRLQAVLDYKPQGAPTIGYVKRIHREVFLP